MQEKNVLNKCRFETLQTAAVCFHTSLCVAVSSLFQRVQNNRTKHRMCPKCQTKNEVKNAGLNNPLSRSARVNYLNRLGSTYMLLFA